MPEGSITPEQPTGLRSFIDKAKLIRVQRNKGIKDAVLRTAIETEKENRLTAESRAENAENEAAIDGMTSLLTNKAYTSEKGRILDTISRDAVMPSAQGIRIDLDNFGEINKKYGQTTGDKVLAKIGNLIKESIRSSDTAGRLGGEEFEVTAPRTKNPNRVQGEKLIPLSEKIRKSIIEADMEHGIKITASFGVAEYQKGEQISKYNKRLENAQITAKRLGKNRVVEAKLTNGDYVYLDHSTGKRYKVERDLNDQILDPEEIK